MASLGPSVAQRRLARALRRLRANAGLTIQQVAGKTDLSASAISRLETARANVRRGDVLELLEIYGVTGAQREVLRQLAGQATSRSSRWEEFKDLPNAATADLEREAAVVRQYAVQLVPGILQTEAYASEILRCILTDDDAKTREQQLKLRVDRQLSFTEQKLPLYEIVLDEAAVRRDVGGPEVMGEQIQRLIEAFDLPNLTLQLLPFAAGAHEAMDGDFMIFSYENFEDMEGVYEDPDVLYLENLAGGLFIEDQTMTDRYKLNFERLRNSRAWDPLRSREALADIERKLQDSTHH